MQKQFFVVFFSRDPVNGLTTDLSSREDRFGHMGVSEFEICICIPTVSKSGDLSLGYADFTIYKMAAVRHFEFSKF